VEYLFYGPENVNLYATHLRFDGLVVGTLLAYWTYFEPEKIARLRRRPLVLLVVGASLAAPTLIYNPEGSVWTFGIGLTCVYIGFGLILLGWINLERTYPFARKCFSSHAAAFLGQVGFYSYSIYLWHIDFARTPIQKIVAMASGHVPASILWLGATGIYVIAAVVVGSTLSRLFEIPSLAMRDRLFPKIKIPATKNRPEDCSAEQAEQEVNIKAHLSGRPV
jgi:peptidoglycan/LPS O-acetylase OafA/YrhL